MSLENNLIVYDDYKSNFKGLLGRDHSFAIHERIIQYLAIEADKVKNGLYPHDQKLCI